MTVIFFLIGCSMILAGGFLAAFFWSVRNGQHDDLHAPGVRVLFDDELTDKPNIDNESLCKKNNSITTTV